MRGGSEIVGIILTNFPHSNNHCLATVLFFLYAILFLWLITRLSFFKKIGLPVLLLISLFSIRILAGVFSCYLSLHYFPVSDSLTFHNISLNENYLLLNQPKYFFYNLFTDVYHNHFSGLFSTTHSFWNNLRMNLIVKSLAVIDIFTLGNFYTNTLFYNYAVFSGAILLYRATIPFIQKGKWLLIFGIFLFPSALFFTSGIQKEGLIILCTGFIFYNFYRLLHAGFTFKRVIGFLSFFTLLFLLRNFTATILAPSLLIWVLCHYFPKKKWIILPSVFVLCILLFFGAKRINPSADFPKIVSERYIAFDTISRVSNTYLPMKMLEPDFEGFVRNAPVALQHAIFLPSLPVSLKTLPFTLELYAVWIFLLFTIWKKRKSGNLPALFIALGFFSFINIVMIGFTIPNLGAILRYRSIYLQFVFICIVGYYNSGTNYGNSLKTGKP